MLRLSLRYPNGRSHELDYEGPRRFHVGSEFHLYGRRWRVSDIGLPRGARRGDATRLVTCLPLTERCFPAATTDALDGLRDAAD